MAELRTRDGDTLATVSTVTFNDARTEVGFVVDEPGALTAFEDSTSYILHTDDGEDVTILPHTGEGDRTKQRWVCYVT